MLIKCCFVCLHLTLNLFFLPVALLPLDTIVTEACKLQGILAYSTWCLQVTSHTPLHSKTKCHTSTLGRAASPRHDSAHGINLRRQCTPHLPVYMLPAVCCHRYRHVTRATVVSRPLVLRPADIPHFRSPTRQPQVASVIRSWHVKPARDLACERVHSAG